MKKKEEGISRRNFFKAGAGLAAAGGLMVPRVATAEQREGRLATLIDLNLCDGCPDRPVPACVTACKSARNAQVPKPVDPIPAPFPVGNKGIEDWSNKQDVHDRLTPYNRIFVQKADVEVDGAMRTLSIPRRCMHCDNPACATICPFAANHKNESGAVVIDPDLCFGGAKCRTVCPWEIPQRQSGVGIYLHVLPTLAGNGVMFKCDLCADRLKDGGLPACVEACPRQALLIGPREKIFALAEERAGKSGGYLYGKKENGGTSTLYVSPVPFNVLDRAVAKGKGRPGFGPMPRKMEKTDGLGRAVLISPVAGAAAGIAGALGYLSKRKERVKEEEKQDG
ncbi:MAG: 4Fe-4S dicluster domain-containing protein [Syntrophaceae bacterium]|nr:4Fe-4S dicluster domain-containing protein [Syntrophaceae bacterium]